MTPFLVTAHGPELPVSRRVMVGSGQWHIAEEVPIAFVYNRRNYAVMMGTPADLPDFALGFSLTEGVIQSAEEIVSLDIFRSERGVDFRFKISSDALARLDITLRRRNLVGSASCGLCGLENADVLFKALPKVSDEPMDLQPEAMRKALAALPADQTLNRNTRSVHGAAWADFNGDLLLVREDVGRHNAVDKVIGGLAAISADMADGFIVISSRCSYEIVEKAAQHGVRALLSVSAPTAFAIEKAREASLALYARAGENVVRVK